MKPGHCLMTMVALVSALGAGLPARAASDCLSIQLAAPATMCAGQSSSIAGIVTNSCPTRLNATGQIAIDGQTLPYEVGFTVGANASRTKSIGFPVPASASTSHTLTISLTDAGGDSASATLDMSITSCAGTTSGSKNPGGRVSQH
jgi:hypothetical protein